MAPQISLQALRRPLRLGERCLLRGADDSRGSLGEFESEHVSQFLAQTHETDREERQLRRGDRWFCLSYVLIGVAVFIFLTLLLLPDHAALYLEILKALGIFGAGAAGGYGLRAYQDRRPDSPRDS